MSGGKDMLEQEPCPSKIELLYVISYAAYSTHLYFKAGEILERAWPVVQHVHDIIPDTRDGIAIAVQVKFLK